MSEQATTKRVTDYDQLYPGRFMKWGEFGGRDVTLTIADVVLDTLEGEKGEQLRPVISFVETKKQLTPCKTNGLCLKAMFGRSVADWTGKKVTFYGDPTVKLGSKAVGGIRVRGAPGLAAPVDVEIKLPKRKAFTMTMQVTGTKKPAPSTGLHDPYGQPPEGA
jgi:hypothetical protein